QQNNSNIIPVVAIGGINLERAPQVLATGVDSIAVVTAITEAKQPEEAVKQLVAYTRDNSEFT
ncbi:MAG: thiamine phosphate synthase, partial [Colwellia sp.]|nr:thiamine phosphate synthase [Colwellia sp.]